MSYSGFGGGRSAYAADSDSDFGPSYGRKTSSSKRHSGTGSANVKRPSRADDVTNRLYQSKHGSRSRLADSLGGAGNSRKATAPRRGEDAGWPRGGGGGGGGGGSGRGGGSPTKSRAFDWEVPNSYEDLSRTRLSNAYDSDSDGDGGLLPRSPGAVWNKDRGASAVWGARDNEVDGDAGRAGAGHRYATEDEEASDAVNYTTDTDGQQAWGAGRRDTGGRGGGRRGGRYMGDSDTAEEEWGARNGRGVDGGRSARGNDGRDGIGTTHVSGIVDEMERLPKRKLFDYDDPSVKDVVHEHWRSWGPASFGSLRKATAAVEMGRVKNGPSIARRPTSLDAKWQKYLQRKALRWDFDMISFAERCDGNALLYMGEFLFNHFGICEEFQIPRDVLRNWLLTVQERYNARVAYHNSVHGADVAHATAMLLNHRDVRPHYTTQELFCAVFSALIHDVDHPGVNNAFLINTQSDMALLYNDTSVLEQHHLFVGWHATLDSEETNVLKTLPKANFKAFRKNSVSLVLATDLAHHFDHVKRFEGKATSVEGIKPDDPADKLMVQTMAIKCGDMNHPCKSWGTHHKWSMRVLREMTRQAELEFKLGLSDKKPETDPADIPKSQVGFVNLFVAPMFRTFAKHISLDDQLSLLDRNISRWNAMMVKD